jgi:hypothetical protein
MDPIFTLVVLGLLVAAFGPVPRRKAGGILDLFGGGFVRYRGDPRWPRGVQEEDLVAWALHDATLVDGVDDSGPLTAFDEPALLDDPAPPEVIEVDTRSAVRDSEMRRVRRH